MEEKSGIYIDLQDGKWFVMLSDNTIEVITTSNVQEVEPGVNYGTWETELIEKN